MTVSIFVRNAAAIVPPPTYQDGLVLDLFDDPKQSTIDANLRAIVEQVGKPSQPGVDLSLLGAAIYVADKKVLRRHSADRWTREFLLQAPVDAPERWEAATPALIEALSFLTGDRWNCIWRSERNRIPGARPRDTYSADAVCLFSGGLDSLAGAIDLLEEPSHQRVTLIAHYDSLLTPSIQQRLAQALIEQYGDDRVRLVQVRVRPATGGRPEYALPSDRESTTRSRSFVFLALGMAAASALGTHTPLYIPENGFIALNVPLTSARLGSCSTRTTHPYFLAQFRAVLDTIGLDNPIVNPYAVLTKGEVLEQCSNRALLLDVASESVSCAHPEVGRYEGLGYGNCGYCFPCLIRRASLHAVGADDPQKYIRDVCTDATLFERGRARGRDARAVFAGLRAASDPIRSGALAPLLAGPIPSGASLRDYARLYRQGLDELRTLFQDKGSPDVRSFAGL